MNGIKMPNANFDTFGESVSAPSNLTGAGSAYVNQPMTYNASGAACNYGHAVQYRAAEDAADTAATTRESGAPVVTAVSAVAVRLSAPGTFCSDPSRTIAVS